MTRKIPYVNTEVANRDFKYYIFDWDDNILHMPTLIHLERKGKDGVWRPVRVSPSTFALVRTDTEHYRAPAGGWAEAFRNFEDAPGRNTFIEDTIAALGKGFAESRTLGKGRIAVFKDRVNAGDATVELVLAPNGTAKHNGGIFCLGGANATTQRGFWLYQHNEAAKGQFMFSAVTYHGQNGNYDGLWTGPFSDTRAYTWAFLLNSGSEDSSLNKNGEFVQSFTRYSVDTTDPTCYIGILPGTYIGSNFRANAKVHSIRVYNRKLTADELARNARVDVQRFRGEVLVQAFSDYQRLRRGLFIVVQ